MKDIAEIKETLKQIKGELNVAREHYQKAIDLDNNFQPALDAINDLN